jgi:hypothetical protein
MVSYVKRNVKNEILIRRLVVNVGTLSLTMVLAMTVVIADPVEGVVSHTRQRAAATNIIINIESGVAISVEEATLGELVDQIRIVSGIEIVLPAKFSHLPVATSITARDWLRALQRLFYDNSTVTEWGPNGRIKRFHVLINDTPPASDSRQETVSPGDAPILPMSALNESVDPTALSDLQESIDAHVGVDQISSEFIKPDPLTVATTPPDFMEFNSASPVPRRIEKRGSPGDGKDY